MWTKHDWKTIGDLNKILQNTGTRVLNLDFDISASAHFCCILMLLHKNLYNKMKHYERQKLIF